jgi:hypothetical protein
MEGGAMAPAPRRRMVVDTRPLPLRRVETAAGPIRWQVVVAGVVVFAAAGVAGLVLGLRGAHLIAQALGALGAAGAVAFLLYAVATVRHRAPGHHCPGCPDH